MMVVDTSALVAIVLNEPEAHSFIAELAIRKAVVSVATVIELHSVLTGKFPQTGRQKAEAILKAVNPKVKGITQKQMKIAVDALHAYGKGRHPAALNFGDCFTYALAKSLQLPLLYKGNDFSRTDVVSVI